VGLADDNDEFSGGVRGRGVVDLYTSEPITRALPSTRHRGWNDQFRVEPMSWV
ncbi:hypothetical protein TorRG33x02_319680, partial [Trema orientale]